MTTITKSARATKGIGTTSKTKEAIVVVVTARKAMACKFCRQMYILLCGLICIICIFDKQLNNVHLPFALADQRDDRPNVVIVMADDLGFDDVSFRGSNQFLTPNIDALAYSGVILKNMYTPALCTPSRAALLTGKYPINTGMQHSSIGAGEPWGLPLNETTMAQVFQEHGYYTSLFGKWHLGMARRNFSPTLRGFNKHFGYLGEHIDYFDQTHFDPDLNFSRGHDFRNNLRSSNKYTGTYVTNLLTEAAVNFIGKHNASAQPLFMILSHLAPHAGNQDAPLQAPKDEIEKFEYINDKKRRTYAAMVSLLDKSVGELIDALYRKNILENTIILFYSDNGGPSSTTASNYPLKGQKNSPWEGGIRSSAAIWSTKIEKLRTVCKQRFYVADILPTLATAAGLHLDEYPYMKLDGIDLWSALKYGYQSVEREILHNIDEVSNYVAYTSGKWKLINGTTYEGVYDKWLGSRSTKAEVDPREKNYVELIRNTTVWQQLNIYNAIDTVNIAQLRNDAGINCLITNGSLGTDCDALNGPCLFDIDVDPCEQNNLYEQQKNSKLVQQMLLRIEYFRENARSVENLPVDFQCDPAYYDNEWTWWIDQQKSSANSLKKTFVLVFLLIIFLI